VSQVIGKLCSIHYVDGHTCRQERTRTYDVWAWSINPSGIAKEVWLTITDPDEFPSSDFQVHHSAPTGLKFGLSYKLLIHVDVVEDLSFIEGRNIQDRKRRREFEWNYGVPDSLGEKREKVVYQDAGRKGRYHRRDEDREDPGRGGRHLRSRSWWDGRGSHCRGAVDDCYSNNNKHLFRGSSSYRSRDLSQNSWGHGSWLSNQVAAVKPQHMGTYSLKSSSIGKNVSFASPIATVLGAANTGDLRGPSVFISNTPSTVSCAFHDPMLDEALLSSGVVGGHNSSVMCWELQNSVAREGSAASPPTMMEVDGSDKRTNTAVPEPSLLPSEVQPSPCLVDFISSITRPVSPPLIAQTPHTNPYRTGLNLFSQESNHSAPHHIPTDSLNHIPSDIVVEPALPQPHVHETNGYSPLHILGSVSEPTTPLQDQLTKTVPFSGPSTSTQIPNKTSAYAVTRHSTRLANKAKRRDGKGAIQIAQELLAHKLKDLAPNVVDSHNDLVQQLVQHFDQPLSKGKIKAIKTLLENGKQLKKKVRGSKVAPAVLACPTALV
jgi:hypothetical protein